MYSEPMEYLFETLFFNATGDRPLLILAGALGILVSSHELWIPHVRGWFRKRNTSNKNPAKDEDPDLRHAFVGHFIFTNTGHVKSFDIISW